MKTLILSIMIVVSLGGVGRWYLHSQETPQTQFHTTKIARGKLIVTVHATGTLEPEEVVAVNAKVAGSIESVGPDVSDTTKVPHWGSVVKKDTVLAQIGKNLYQAQVQTALADLSKNTADLVQKQALLKKAAGDWERAQALFPKAMSAAEYDHEKMCYEVAKASVDISKAQIHAAEVTLAMAEVNLKNTTIKSPVEGVIIDQHVHLGQIVVPSSSAFSLFLIAKDLSKMEIWATLKEADAGKIQIGQTVDFTVDALPGYVYQGSVKVKGKFSSPLSSPVNQKMGTCTVLLSVANADSKLMPGFTAKLSFLVKDQSDALLVPNAALTWEPSESQLPPATRDTFAGLKAKMKASATHSQELGIVWVQEGSWVRPILVHVGLSDGMNTEILGVLDGILTEGTPVITGKAS